MTVRNILSDWWPVTQDFGLLKIDVGTLVDAYTAWFAELGYRFETRRINADLRHALSSLPPLSMGMARQLFVPTRSGWTAFFRNGLLGSDPAPVVGLFARELNIMTMRVCVPMRDGQAQGAIWEVYAPPEQGGVLPLAVRRAITCIKDGSRWMFEQQGAPFDFEDVSRFEAKLKRERFTPDLLREYLLKFELDAMSDDFYVVDPGHPAVLIDKLTPRDSLPQFSLDDVRLGRPWAG
jgi:hypothetical protein